MMLQISVSQIAANWQWGLVALFALWFLRWYVAERRGIVNFGRLGRPAYALEVVFGGIGEELRQNSRRLMALFAFVFGGLIVLVNTVGFSINFLLMLDPATWMATLVGAFGAVRLLGIDVPLTVGMLAITVIGAAVVLVQRQ